MKRCLPAPKTLSVESQNIWKKIVRGYAVDLPKAVILKMALESLDLVNNMAERIREEGVDPGGDYPKPHYLLSHLDKARHSVLKAFKILNFDSGEVL